MIINDHLPGLPRSSPQTPEQKELDATETNLKLIDELAAQQQFLAASQAELLKTQQKAAADVARAQKSLADVTARLNTKIFAQEAEAKKSAKMFEDITKNKGALLKRATTAEEKLATVEAAKKKLEEGEKKQSKKLAELEEKVETTGLWFDNRKMGEELTAKKARLELLEEARVGAKEAGLELLEGARACSRRRG